MTQSLIRMLSALAVVGVLTTAPHVLAASSVPLISSVIATTIGEKHMPTCVNRTFQAMGTTSAAAGAATIIFEASNVASPNIATAVDWTTLGTITLTLGTTQTNDGFVSDASWRWVRARLSAISGTDATVSAYLGC